MDKETKRRVKILFIGIIGIILLLAGISYATFSANLAGTKIQGMNTGCLKVEMADNGNLRLTNKAPETDKNGLSSDPYTYTITNTCTSAAFYTATINVLSTSNMDNIAKIKVALGGDSYLAPVMEDSLEEIDSVDTSEVEIVKTYKLDEGYLESGDSKTFELRTWIDYDVEEISGKLENKVIILSEARGDQGIYLNTNTAGYQVLKNSDFITNADYKGIAPSANQLSGILKVNIDDDIKYYFRGNPDNYITFAGKTFRILSTNKDGSINIVLDDVLSSVAYANLSTSLNSFYNTISSMESYIKTDSKFCIEKDGEYLAKIKVEKSNPDGKCASNNYMTKVGLLTTDDLMFAGAKAGAANTSFYLAEENSYYTSSYENSTKVYGYSKANSIVSGALTTANGVKPVITLKSDTLIYGEGTKAKPYYVSGTYNTAIENYNDEIAPTITYARVDEKWSKENKQIEIAAKDDSNGSGIAGYLISNSNTKPSVTDSGWEASASQKYMSVNSYDNGIYYVFVKDNDGNISEATKVTVEKVDKVAPTCTIRINPNGTTTEYKTLTILSDDTNIDLEGYSWDHTGSIEDVVKVSENMVYTGYITDLAGNQGSCSATVTTIVMSAAELLMSKVGESGLEEVTHTADSTLQIGTTEDIIEYRFRGGNDVVTNNYVYFNCEDINNQTADTCELYRIIGVFPTDDGTGKIENRIKLIKAENYGNNYWNSNGTNNWAEPATLNTKFNRIYWNTINSKYQTLIGGAKYYLGGYTTSDVNTSVMYGYERKIDESDGGNYYYNTNPTNWTGKIALMYASDYGYAANSECSASITLNDYSNTTCMNNNWLYLGSNEWLLPQNSNNAYHAFIVIFNGYVNHYFNVSDYYDGSHAVRPVFYLTADAKFNNIGDGSRGNPYQLKELSSSSEYASNAVYSWSTSTISLGATKDSISGYTTDYTTLNKTYFLKHNIGSDNTVESNEVCYVLNSNLYCLKGGSADYYEENIQVLYESFGEDNCSVYSSLVGCSASGLNASAYDDGFVIASGDIGDCDVGGIGGATCYEDNGGVPS